MQQSAATVPSSAPEFSGEDEGPDNSAPTPLIKQGHSAQPPSFNSSSLDDVHSCFFRRVDYTEISGVVSKGKKIVIVTTVINFVKNNVR